MDVSKYRDLFVSETREHLVNLNRALLALEKAPTNPALLDEIFRSMHTIKGMAASIEQELVAGLTHQAENLLDGMRKSRRPATAGQIELVFEAVDFLEAAVALIAQGQNPGAHMEQQALELNQRFAVSLAAPVAEEKPAQAASAACDFGRINPLKGPDSLIYKIRVLLESDIPLKSARAFLVLHNLDQIGKVAYTFPERHDLEAERFERGFTVFLVTPEKDKGTIVEMIACSEIEDIQAEEIREETAEETIERKTVGAFIQLAQEKVKDVKVNVARLDNLRNLVGELIVWKDRLRQMASAQADPRLRDGVDQLAKITGDLQHEVLAARLVPMAEIFDRFPRLVRDAAKVLTKEIDFVVGGRELEMDRSILQLLSEPLVHLLRNAVDHGVETPSQRALAGKPQVGTIKLAAQKVKDQVLITVVDDGRGIDREAVRRKVVERGLCPAAEAAALSERQLIDYLCTPGFSTAEKVTEVSGRGVGLDVVKSRVEAMGGSLVIDSVFGQGTTFTVVVPLSLAIIRSLLVATGTMTYAVPLTQVKETLEVKPQQVKRLQGRSLLLYRDRAIPLVDLSQLLGGTRAQPRDAGPALVVEHQQSEIALLIDRIVGQQEIVVKPLSRLFQQVRAYSGTTISQEGTPLLILDINNLIRG
jgi:two-component system chemotaxis sensor kinase CheA